MSELPTDFPTNDSFVPTNETGTTAHATLSPAHSSGLHSSLLENPVQNDLDLFLIQLVLIILITRIVSRILSKMKQPSVIAEIIAGILLGPSVLGYIPGFSATLFPPSSIEILAVIANMGLILFMFFLGMEVEPAAMFATWRKSVPIALLGLIFPWITGGLLSIWLYNIEETAYHSSHTIFFLFIGCAFSFTAMPVLGRILTARNLLHAPLGIEALSIAAVDDLLAWLTLALVLAYSNGGGLNGLYTILVTAAFVLLLVFGVRPLNKWALDRMIAKGKEESRTYIAFILLSLCLSAWFADIIGIHALFGSFVYGLIVPRGHLLDFLAPKVELLVVECFLPLYFAKSGLGTKFGSLTGHDWGVTFVVLLCASLSKIVPVTVGTFVGSKCKATVRHSLSVGFLMNTRGLISLIVLGIGQKAGIIHSKVFTILVFTALVTTFMTSPMLWFLDEKKPAKKPAEIPLQTPEFESKGDGKAVEPAADPQQQEKEDVVRDLHDIYGRQLSMRRISKTSVQIEDDEDRKLSSPLRRSVSAVRVPSAQPPANLPPVEEKEVAAV